MARPRTEAAQYQPVSIRFPKDVLEQCRTHAKKNTRSLNEQVLHVVKRWLEEKGEETHELVSSRND